MISGNLKLISLVFVFSLIIIITVFVKRKKITIKYSIIWYFCLLIILLFVIFPDVLTFLSNLFGIQVTSNFFFMLIIAFLMTILLSLTIIVSKHKEQIITLIQEVSILKKKVSDERK